MEEIIERIDEMLPQLFNAIRKEDEMEAMRALFFLDREAKSAARVAKKLEAERYILHRLEKWSKTTNVNNKVYVKVVAILKKEIEELGKQVRKQLRKRRKRA